METPHPTYVTIVKAFLSSSDISYVVSNIFSSLYVEYKPVELQKHLLTQQN